MATSLLTIGAIGRINQMVRVRRWLPCAFMITSLLSMAMIVSIMIKQQAPKVFLDFEQDESIGNRPYEMEWSNRKETRQPTITFYNLSGWHMELQGDAVAAFRPSRSQNVWNRAVGKLTYLGNGDQNSQPRVILFPGEPIPIPNGSDCVEMWIYGNRWDWENPPDTPPVRIYVHLSDDEGEIQRILVDGVRWKEWWLLHRKLPTLPNGSRFSALEVEGGWQHEERTLFIDSVAFFEEALPSLDFPARPKRNLTPLQGQSPGMNTGPGCLEFPIREETILPVNIEGGFRTELVREGEAYILRYIGNDCELVYNFDPRQGLSGIGASINGEPIGQLLFGGGVKFAGEGNEGELIRSELHDDVIVATYATGVTYRVRLWQKSLVMDVSHNNTGLSAGGEATELSFGEIRGAQEPRAIYVPFITYGSSNPVVLMGLAGGDLHYFASIWLDWYRSGGSEPYAFPNGEITPTGVRINGGVRYNPKTDGKRNDLFERFFVTVSPTFEEVLPVISNPVGVNARMAIDRLWQESWGPQDYEREIERSRKLRAYGIVELIQCNHEITWRDGGESFTLRTRAAPGKGGDEALQGYLAQQKSMGWFAGLYTNYCDFAPVNEYWNSDYVQRTSDGNWRPAWPRCWALKPVAAAIFEERLAPIIKSKFHPDGAQVSAYTDVHTAVAPWNYCDYDSRVPGAGTFAQTFYCYGELLRRDSRTYGGPVFSEGTYQWLYAGLTDGNYGLTYNGRPIAREPLIPTFFLREIHTKECEIGMAWTDWFLQGIADWQLDTDVAIDRFLLHEIAYGTNGWLVEEKFGMERVCRSYYMLQRLQSRYGLLQPTEVSYWDGNELVSTSEAIAMDLPTKRRQLQVSYPNGLRIWANDWVGGDGPESIWPVRLGDITYEIPPAGWLAVQGSSFVTFSAIVEGHKVDFLRDIDAIKGEEPLMYVDGRGNLTEFPEVKAKGAIAVRLVNQSKVEVIDISGGDGFGLNHPFGVKGIPIKCDVFDIQGNALGTTEIQQEQHYHWIVTRPDGHLYLISFSGG